VVKSSVSILVVDGGINTEVNAHKKRDRDRSLSNSIGIVQ
jgi:hypothetical protein